MSGSVWSSHGAYSVRWAWYAPNFLLHLAILTWIASQGRAATLSTDVQALIAIKAEVDPLTVKVSSCLESWNFSFDPCEPALPQAFVCGVRCTIQGAQYRVTSLTLSGSGYKGVLSEYIGNLSALQSADISGNSFQGNVPVSMGKLEQLRWLDLSSNLFSGWLPASLGQLPNLRYLSVSSNQLNGSIPNSFSNLWNVTELYLARNRLTGGFPVLGNLKQLLYLDASNNLLSGSLPLFPPQLVRVVLRGNSFSGQLPRSLKLLSQLTVLDMSHNNLTGTVGSFIFKLPALQQLNLSGNHLTALYVPRIRAVPSELATMDVSSNQLRGLLPPELGKFERLSGLTLSHNLLSGGIPDTYALKAAGSVQGVQPFSLLYLDGNYLDGIIPPTFLTMPQDSLSASFINNCLQNCSSNQLFCQGGDQKSQAECDAFQKRV